MEIQVEIRKLHALIQKYLKKEIPLLMLTNQNKVWCIKIKQRSENSRESGFSEQL